MEIKAYQNKQTYQQIIFLNKENKREKKSIFNLLKGWSIASIVLYEDSIPDQDALNATNKTYYKVPSFSMNNYNFCLKNNNKVVQHEKSKQILKQE